MNYDDTSRECHENACKKGFYDDLNDVLDNLKQQKHRDFVTHLWRSHRLMLIVSELSEALEGLRHHNMSGEPKSGGYIEELSDAQIRMFDLFYSLPLNKLPSKYIQDKMDYNSTRPFKHNKES